MGVCSISKTYKITSITVAPDPLLACRSNLINRLIFINKLKVKCNQAIETCLLAEDEKKAMLLKAKHLELKKLEKLVQQQITILDNSQEELRNQEKRQKLADRITEELENIYQRFDVEDDVSEIMEKISEGLSASVLEKKLEGNNQETRALLQQMVQDQAKKIKNLNKGSSSLRRRYVKAS
jgi:biotin-(acetyl-CoA carboxylase) ligase